MEYLSVFLYFIFVLLVFCLNIINNNNTTNNNNKNINDNDYRNSANKKESKQTSKNVHLEFVYLNLKSNNNNKLKALNLLEYYFLYFNLFENWDTIKSILHSKKFMKTRSKQPFCYSNTPVQVLVEEEYNIASQAQVCFLKHLHNLPINEIVSTFEFFIKCHQESLSKGTKVIVNFSNGTLIFASIENVLQKIHKSYILEKNHKIETLIWELSGQICFDEAYNFYPLSLSSFKILLRSVGEHKIVIRCLKCIRSVSEFNMGIIETFLNTKKNFKPIDAERSTLM
ncbi:hypothetical protein DICPUDRAFT_75754 [Dictyostelium purpureum]|uniref:Uncharacterized protein n=1 Tax=Dictyostelium purpureum TaxID=5786 RepID=F0ZBK7_DICPU|nr:uncharacterized protein DICPUDRAFT_75754 [Dictyostelium purpureum]EGC38684.1 hypothetical protein DICPUDRAFT_75754 [Dictyostelium purpureum]|eukprot:XP_003284780.1 hypothetical protein DICPUDRAFT_75754 [Dictyostelium purpureum]